MGRTVEEVEHSLTRACGTRAAARYLGGPVRQAAKEPPVAEKIAARRHEVEVDHVEKWKTSKDVPAIRGAARLAQEENDPVVLSRSRRITSGTAAASGAAQLHRTHA